MGNYQEDEELMNVLESASNEDIAILIDIITDNGEGRISLDNDVKNKLIKAKDALDIDWVGGDGADQTLVNGKNAITVDFQTKCLIAEEIQKFGGNSLINIFRSGKGVLYKEIVWDVAEHVGANYNKKQDIAQIETAILIKIVEKSMEQMSEDEKKQFFNQFGVKFNGVGPAAIAMLIGAIKLSGFAAYKMATIVAQASAKMLLGKGLSFAATGGLMKGISAFSGPIGWAITGIWTAFDLTSPAYRVTVPCTIQLAYMRQKFMMCVCPECQANISKDMKFCSECGHKLA
jgi:uncharacterized protein YaaW (UPF0174 family)